MQDDENYYVIVKSDRPIADFESKERLNRANSIIDHNKIPPELYFTPPLDIVKGNTRVTSHIIPKTTNKRNNNTTTSKSRKKKTTTKSSYMKKR